METYQATILVLIIISATALALTTRREEIKFEYPERVNSERDLSVCGVNEVCSVIHRRFWVRPVIDRLCRCPTGQQCPWQWTWSNKTDDQTMALSNRSQMKFCESIAELPECEPEQNAIVIGPHIEAELKPGHKNKIKNMPVRESVVINCRCQDRHYWKLSTANERNATNEDATKIYNCIEVKKCWPKGFCGNIRSDYFSTYYRCSCPVGHMCLFQNHTTYNVNELLYEGPAYKAICLRNIV